MLVRSTKSQFELNEFIGKQNQSCFLQSWQWGEFQAELGHKIFRLALEESREIRAAATIIKITLPLGKSYFYCPRGPIVEGERQKAKGENIELLLKEVYRLAKVEQAIFFRFEPAMALQTSNFKFQIYKTLDIQPGKTLLLDLTKSEQELLAAMRQKTRYNIRLAEKKGVKIVAPDDPLFGNSQSGFERFWRLMQETVRRDGFRLHSKSYYRKMLEVFFNQAVQTSQGGTDRPMVKLLLAEYEQKVIAGSLVAFCGDSVSYLHGASSYQHRNLMAPYLLQWQCLKLAKQRGYKYYDFYGIDEKKWPGVTRFKQGFGGQEINYPGTFDLVFAKKWYLLYRLARKLRRSL